MYSSFSSTTFETLFPGTNTTRIMPQMRAKIKMHVGLYVNYPLFLSDFKKNWNMLTNCSKIPENGIQ
jgi:hypothetical protein